MSENSEIAQSASARINLEQARKRARELVNAHQAGDPHALDSIRWNHRRFRGQTDEQIRAGRFVLADAQQVVARGHHFESWAKLLEYVRTIEDANPDVARFENAADAIVTGDLDGLRAILDAHPELIRQRSTRAHHSTLLHYTSANGVEDYRQKTPANIVHITRLLLDRGAEVDATSEAYGGGSTTLGLVSTSAHPRLRGVQIELMDLLLEYGANIDGPDTLQDLARWSLGNGCPEAANAFIERGRHLRTLFSAAADGNLELVKALFPAASPKQRIGALSVAAKTGNADVLVYLLDNGMSPNGHDGMPPVQAAASNSQYATMELLIERGASLEELNEYGGTALSGTVWFAMHVLDDEFRRRDYPRVIEWLIAHGARDGRYPELTGEIEMVRRRGVELSRE